MAFGVTGWLLLLCLSVVLFYLAVKVGVPRTIPEWKAVRGDLITVVSLVDGSIRGTKKIPILDRTDNIDCQRWRGPHESLPLSWCELSGLAVGYYSTVRTWSHNCLSVPILRNETSRRHFCGSGLINNIGGVRCIDFDGGGSADIRKNDVHGYGMSPISFLYDQSSVRVNGVWKGPSWQSCKIWSLIPNKIHSFVADRIFGSSGRTVRLMPLALGEIYSQSQPEESQDRYEDDDPITPYFNVKWRPWLAGFTWIVALLFAWIGFWNVKSARTVEDISLRSMCRLLLGSGFVALAWVLIHVALDISELGRIYLRHFIA